MKRYFKVLVYLILSNIIYAQNVPIENRNHEVSELITDANGWLWSRVGSIVNTDINQNVLAVRYNSLNNNSNRIYFTTGVNDEVVFSNLGLQECESNFQQDCISSQYFSAFPSKLLSNASSEGLNKNLIGIPKKDRETAYLNYPNNFRYYLEDGKKGLDIHTAIFNITLVSGLITYNDIIISEESIGDDIPDIIVTQTGGLSAVGGGDDEYFFTNAQGEIVGDAFFVNFNNVGIVLRAYWAFYHYSHSATEDAMLTNEQYDSTISNTDNGGRDIRILALDWSDLGINTTNYLNAKSFNQRFNGASDVAFIAYNEKSLRYIRDVSGTILEVDLDGITKRPFNKDLISVDLCVLEDGVLNENSCITQLIGDDGSYIFEDVPSNFPLEKYHLRIKLKEELITDPFYVVENIDETLEDFVEFELDLDNIENVDFVLGNFCIRNPLVSGTIGRSTPIAISTLDKNPEDWPNYIPNAFLVLESKNKGFVIPRLDASAIDIAILEEGMIVYDIIDNCVKLYDGVKWFCVQRDCNE